MLCSIVVAVSGWFKVDAVLIRVHKELNIDTTVYGWQIGLVNTSNRAVS